MTFTPQSWFALDINGFTLLYPYGFTLISLKLKYALHYAPFRLATPMVTSFAEVVFLVLRAILSIGNIFFTITNISFNSYVYSLQIMQVLS